MRYDYHGQRRRCVIPSRRRSGSLRRVGACVVRVLCVWWLSWWLSDEMTMLPCPALSHQRTSKFDRCKDARECERSAPQAELPCISSPASFLCPASIPDGGTLARTLRALLSSLARCSVTFHITLSFCLGRFLTVLAHTGSLSYLTLVHTHRIAR